MSVHVICLLQRKWKSEAKINPTLQTMNSINALENDLYGLTISQEGHLVWGKNTIHKDLCSLKYIILEEMNDRARCCNVLHRHATIMLPNMSSKSISAVSSRSTAVTSHKYPHRSGIETSARLLLAAGYDSLCYLEG